MIKVYVYHDNDKIYQVRYDQNGPEEFIIQELQFETIPSYVEIEQKFYEIKGE